MCYVEGCMWLWLGKWSGNEWNLGIILQHFSGIYVISALSVVLTCLTMFTEHLLCAENRPEKMRRLLYLLIWGGKRMCVCATAGVNALWQALSEWPGPCAAGASRGHLWRGSWGLGSHSFPPSAFLPSILNFSKLHKFLRGKGALFVDRTLRRTLFKRKSVTLALRRRIVLPEFWFQYPCVQPDNCLVCISFSLSFWLWQSPVSFLLHEAAHVRKNCDVRSHISVIFTLLVFEILMVNDFESILGL